jgi:hypothetical protein
MPAPVPSIADILRRAARSPSVHLAALAFVVALAVEPGHLGSVDTERRLQVAHALWTGDPHVRSDDADDMKIPGRDGRVYPPYGIGQSLLMLPADVAVSAVTSRMGGDPCRERLVRCGLVSLLVFPPLAALGVVLAMHVLAELGFSPREAVAGAVGLLLATSFLHYTHIHQENSLTWALTLTGLLGVLRWRSRRCLRWLLAGSAALGYNLLIRPTTGLDLIAVGLFALALIRREDPASFRRAFREGLLVAVPTVLAFAAAERAWQWHRFGSPLSTYIHLYGENEKARVPGLPAEFPFSHPFAAGLLNPLLSPEKSVFLFDPLLPATAGLGLLFLLRAGRSRRADEAAAPGPGTGTDRLRLMWIAGWLLLAGYFAFYARWAFPSGENSWGDRFSSVPVQWLAMLAVPMWMRFAAPSAPRAVRWAAGTFAGAAVWIQVSSVVLSYNLECLQRQTCLTGPTCVVWLRQRNIAALAEGRFEGSELSCGGAAAVMRWTEIDLLPFKVGRIAGPIATSAAAVGWTGLLAGSATLLGRLYVRTRRGDFDPLPERP